MQIIAGITVSSSLITGNNVKDLKVLYCFVMFLGSNYFVVLKITLTFATDMTKVTTHIDINLLPTTSKYLVASDNLLTHTHTHITV
jgi:hypothetical protein